MPEAQYGRATRSESSLLDAEDHGARELGAHAARRVERAFRFGTVGLVACSILAMAALGTVVFFTASYVRGRNSKAVSLVTVASEGQSAESVLDAMDKKDDEDPAAWAPASKGGRVKYNLTENYHNSGFIAVPKFEQKNDSWPRLFCWLIMQTVGNNPMGWEEEKLVKHQLTRGIGIFACNDWAVMTDVALALNRWGQYGFPRITGNKPNPEVDMATWSLGSLEAQKGPQSNPLNSLAFRTAWDALRSSGQLEGHDWIVKVDPDAVFFPSRLREHLKAYMPGHGNGWDNVFLENCPRFQSMQGPIEVISKKGATTLETGIKWCGGVWGSGEDQFLTKCLQQLGVGGTMEPTLLNDVYCDGYADCDDSWKVAFHPHKSTWDFDKCYNASWGAELKKQAKTEKQQQWN